MNVPSKQKRNSSVRHWPLEAEEPTHRGVKEEEMAMNGQVSAQRDIERPESENDTL